MAVRRATRQYRSVVEFLEDHAGLLSQGMVLLPAGTLDGEPAPELKLDLVVPPIGRLGPILAQVVHRAADGSVALRVPEWPASVEQRIADLLQAVDDLRDWFVEQGQLVDARGVPAPPAEPASAPAPPPGDAARPARPAGRGFAVPDLRGVEPDARGSRDPAELRPALIRFAAERRTGLLTLTRPDGQVRYGFWYQGGPVGFRTEPLDEGEVLGVLLYKARQISKEQLRESLEIMQKEGCRQGEAFIQMGVMTFPQLVMVLGKQTEFVFQRALADTTGEWTFHSLDTLPERFLPSPLKVPAMLFRSLVQQAREMKSDTLYASLKDYLDRYIFLPESSAGLIPDMRFSPNEARLIETIQNNSWRLREVYSVSPLSRAMTAAVLRALIDLDFFEFRAEQSDQRARAALQALIDRKKDQIFKGSHFDVLEVHWICITEEVDRAYQRLKSEFTPARFQGMPPTAIADVSMINQKLDEAHAVLSDPHRRREYRKEVVEESKIVESAALLAKQGEMAVLRNDRDHATTCFAKAVELAPGIGDYRAGLQRARALR
ncbi:MAG: hypothetical protein D6798_18500 [Deltaproteobacteria bacterium]|nr:MAG: hypothetical protein D6798_18500 [Deltaproteobacteria bacterium]